MPEVPGVREFSEHLQRIGMEHEADSTTWMFGSRDQGGNSSHCGDEGNPARETGLPQDEVSRTQNCKNAEPAEGEPQAERKLQGAAGKQDSQPTYAKLPSSCRQFIERKSASVFREPNADAQ